LRIEMRQRVMGGMKEATMWSRGRSKAGKGLRRLGSIP
jgi:hypothetical protein